MAAAPIVGDKILVPDNKHPNNPIARELVGGRATVHKVVCAQISPPIHYIWVLEHTPFTEYLWEGSLADMQEELANCFDESSQAYFK